METHLLGNAAVVCFGVFGESHRVLCIVHVFYSPLVCSPPQRSRALMFGLWVLQSSVMRLVHYKTTPPPPEFWFTFKHRQRWKSVPFRVHHKQRSNAVVVWSFPLFGPLPLSLLKQRGRPPVSQLDLLVHYCLPIRGRWWWWGGGGTV